MLYVVNGNLNKITLLTSPYKLLLNSTVKCINENNTNCNTYYINNVMLGQEITFDACVLDQFNQPTKATDFVVSGMEHQDYNISVYFNIVQSKDSGKKYNRKFALKSIIQLFNRYFIIIILFMFQTLN